MDCVCKMYVKSQFCYEFISVKTFDGIMPWFAARISILRAFSAAVESHNILDFHS